MSSAPLYCRLSHNSLNSAYVVTTGPENTISPNRQPHQGFLQGRQTRLAIIFQPTTYKLCDLSFQKPLPWETCQSLRLSVRYQWLKGLLTWQRHTQLCVEFRPEWNVESSPLMGKRRGRQEPRPYPKISPLKLPLIVIFRVVKANFSSFLWARVVALRTGS